MRQLLGSIQIFTTSIQISRDRLWSIIQRREVSRPAPEACTADRLWTINRGTGKNGASVLVIVVRRTVTKRRPRQADATIKLIVALTWESLTVRSYIYERFQLRLVMPADGHNSPSSVCCRRFRQFQEERERERNAYAVAFVRASGHHQADAAAHLLSPQ